MHIIEFFRQPSGVPNGILFSIFLISGALGSMLYDRAFRRGWNTSRKTLLKQLDSGASHLKVDGKVVLITERIVSSDSPNGTKIITLVDPKH
jgi:hypothetical protein